MFKKKIMNSNFTSPVPKTQLWKPLVGVSSLLFMAACASHPKSEMASTDNPQHIIEQLDSEMKEGASRHYDVLADQDFKKAQKYLQEAREDIKDNDDQADVLESLSISKGYLDRAQATANKNAEKLSSIISARQGALLAGARNYPQQNDKLKELDSEIQSEIDDIDDIKSDWFAQMQRDYMQLEISTVQAQQLNTARSRVIGSEDKKAEKYAPNTLKQAKKNLLAAENVIATNVNTPHAYKEAVMKANASSQFLVAVLAASQRDGKTIPESVAVELVKKNQNIDHLSAALDETQDELSMAQTTNQRQSQALMSEKQKTELDTTIAALSKEFDKKEAEVYRQEDKLLIRLKGIAFKTGTADLPGKTVELLTKVKDTVESLNASEVIVEGHTDSSGSKALNKELSQKRAESVASYLTSNGVTENIIRTQGFGFEKPIASNKSKMGREQNRRVDVIITPSVQRGSPQGSASSIR